jgi:GMP synthase (glutamine-hydrolysing)
MARPRILIADCAPAAMQAELTRCGGPTNVTMFETALRLHAPELFCDSINIAEGETLPFGTDLASYDGVVLTGSPLHIYDDSPAVTGQIAFARSAFAAGRSVWGSCWGLQLATVALGGTVRRNPNGREVGIARRILLTEAGRSHWLLTDRPACFDALCSHLDEVETAPPGAVVLASNGVSAVQAMAAHAPNGGSFVGTQYHPEHSFTLSATLIRMRASFLVSEGLGHSEAALDSLAADFVAMDAEPGRRDLAWRYGVDAQVLEPRQRTAELGQWLRRLPRRD